MAQNYSKSLIASLLLHGAILVMALVVLPNPSTFEVKPQDAIQVDISMIGNVSKRQAQSKSAEKKVEKAAPKAAPPSKTVEPPPKVDEKVNTAAKEPAAEPEPPKPEPPKPEPPKPPEPKKVEEPKPLDPDPLKQMIEKTDEPKPLNDDPLKEVIKQEEEAQKAAEAKAKAEAVAKAKAEAAAKAKAEAKAKADAKAKAEAKAKAKAEKKKLNDMLADVADDLNKIEGERTAPAKASTENGDPTAGNQDVQGTDDAMVATITEALVSKTKDCWTVPPSARESDFAIRVHFSLNPDGTVAGTPEVVNTSADPVFRAAAQSAVSAIAGCNYSEVLPPDQYDMWKDNTLDFVPNMMFGT